MPKEKSIYRVAFKKPQTADGRKDYYFTSLSAIYDVLTVEQVGVDLNVLYAMRVTLGTPYKGEQCTITREPIMSKEQAHPKRSKKTDEEQRTDAALHEC